MDQYLTGIHAYNKLSFSHATSTIGNHKLGYIHTLNKPSVKYYCFLGQLEHQISEMVPNSLNLRLVRKPETYIKSQQPHAPAIKDCSSHHKSFDLILETTFKTFF